MPLLDAITPEYKTIFSLCEKIGRIEGEADECFDAGLSHLRVSSRHFALPRDFGCKRSRHGKACCCPRPGQNDQSLPAPCTPYARGFPLRGGLSASIARRARTAPRYSAGAL